LEGPGFFEPGLFLCLIFEIVFLQNDIIRSAQLPLGFVTFEASKVTKNACQQKGFSSHWAFALQIRQNHGLQNAALLRSLHPALQQLLLCPSNAQGHHCFA